MIPRGGPALIKQGGATTRRIPVIKHDAGVCHVFLDAQRRPRDGARDRARLEDPPDGGVQRRSRRCSCTAARRAAVLPAVLKALHEQGVEIRG